METVAFSALRDGRACVSPPAEPGAYLLGVTLGGVDPHALLIKCHQCLRPMSETESGRYFDRVPLGRFEWHCGCSGEASMLRQFMASANVWVTVPPREG